MVAPSQLYCLPDNSIPTFEYTRNSEEKRVIPVIFSPAPISSTGLIVIVGAHDILNTLSLTPTKTDQPTFIEGRKADELENHHPPLKTHDTLLVIVFNPTLYRSI